MKQGPVGVTNKHCRECLAARMLSPGAARTETMKPERGAVRLALVALAVARAFVAGRTSVSDGLLGTIPKP